MSQTSLFRTIRTSGSNAPVRSVQRLLFFHDVFNHTIPLVLMVLKTPVLTTRNEMKNKKNRLAIEWRNGPFQDHRDQSLFRLYVRRCCLIVGSNINPVVELILRSAIQMITHFPYPGVGVKRRVVDQFPYPVGGVSAPKMGRQPM